MLVTNGVHYIHCTCKNEILLNPDRTKEEPMPGCSDTYSSPSQEHHQEGHDTRADDGLQN